MFGNLDCGNVTGDAPVSYWPIFSLSLVTVPEVFAMFTRPSFLHVSKVANRPLPSSENPHFKNEAKCTNFHVKMSFICMRMKNHFHIKGWALNLVLIQRPGGTRKWSISCPLHSRLTYLLPSNTMNIYHTGDSMWGPWLVIVVYQVITEGGVGVFSDATIHNIAFAGNSVWASNSAQSLGLKEMIPQCCSVCTV